MIYTKTFPVSEDKFIDRLITSMENNLLDTWGVLTSEVKFYGRCDLIDDKYYWYSGKNEEVLSDTRFKFISYVKVQDEVSYINTLHRVNATLVCQGRLNDLYSSILTELSV